MSALAEFIGGPLDGVIKELAEAVPVYRVSIAPAGSGYGGSKTPPEPSPPLTYVRKGRRTTPSGGVIFQYRLQGRSG